MVAYKWSAYQAVETLFSTDLDGLADAGWALNTTLIDNSTNRSFYADIELVLASAVTVGAGAPSFDLYLLPAPDGTNGPNPPGTTAALIPAQYHAGSIQANASAAFTSGVKRGVVLPPGKWLIGAQNKLGVALPASGNVLNMYRYGEEGV